MEIVSCLRLFTIFKKFRAKREGMKQHIGSHSMQYQSSKILEQKLTLLILTKNQIILI